jgi:hypothetical protein
MHLFHPPGEPGFRHNLGLITQDVFNRLVRTVNQIVLHADLLLES